MTVRNIVRKGLAPVIGSERVDRLVDGEAKARASLASWIAPAERPAPVEEAAPGSEYPLAPNGYRIYPFDASRFPEPTLTRHEFLTGLHEALQPRAYLEIGVDDGRSLTLSHTKTIGVDPAFHIVSPLRSDLLLARETSDDFFASTQAADHLAGTPLDLAFVDGMHWAEFAYRDFVNVEKLCSPLSVVVLDDMMPRTVHEAARDRYTDSWAGDVYKVVELLRTERPDLIVVPVNTFPTGVVLVMAVDPASTVLGDRYDDLLAGLTSADPQDVPDHVIERTRAVDGRDLIAWPGWAELRDLRERPRATAMRRKLLASFAETFVR
ncbi:class I SAM-dependent methyltransferase [Microbacterium sp. X-17]|uniref:class I SAM-dependent methyltransferase n=1 Tax=Microbacterium sp. X-17 TaxID=3144404 RepID=UPI0031F4EAE3